LSSLMVDIALPSFVISVKSATSRTGAHGTHE
jgi:hypothetical protein